MVDVLTHNFHTKMSRNRSSSASDDVAQRQKFMMNCEEKRVESFQDWPFDEGCTCIPSKMAAAGFYHCPTAQEPDLVRCFMCFKELDGWEPTDDPMEEHKSHAPKCPFVTKKKTNENDLTVSEFLKLESLRQHNRVMTQVESRIKEFTYEAQKVREQIEKLKT